MALCNCIFIDLLIELDQLSIRCAVNTMTGWQVADQWSCLECSIDNGLHQSINQSIKPQKHHFYLSLKPIPWMSMPQFDLLTPKSFKNMILKKYSCTDISARFPVRQLRVGVLVKIFFQPSLGTLLPETKKTFLMFTPTYVSSSTSSKTFTPRAHCLVSTRVESQ